VTNPSGIDTSVLYHGGAPDPAGETDAVGGGAGGGGLGGMFGGGLGSLIEQFNRSGHGDVIGSWIGTGRNQPIAPQQLGQALGEDTVATLSRESGMGREDLLAQLSETLPEVVDRLTPEGRVPDQREMSGWV
jgi:uncharacterized protein YidB (DUF937 family)